jgi:hypothetical protein
LTKVAAAKLINGSSIDGGSGIFDETLLDELEATPVPLPNGWPKWVRHSL